MEQIQNSSAKNVVVLLHGFLGSPEDWSFLDTSRTDLCFLKINLFDPQWQNILIADWGKNFKNWFLKKYPDKKIKAVIGYSMGGRLAMSLAQHDPHLSQKWIFIASNPGLLNEAEKAERQEADLKWHKRFLNEKIEDVLKDWNQQSVFKHSAAPERHFSDEQKKILAQQIADFSLAQQPSYWRLPIHQALYVVGEEDSKFLEISLKWKQMHPHMRVSTIKKSGHRILLDAPKELNQILTEELLST